ncbi:uncharacterized protein LOC144713182 [Wolffia australiana]
MDGWERGNGPAPINTTPLSTYHFSSTQRKSFPSPKPRGTVACRRSHTWYSTPASDPSLGRILAQSSRLSLPSFSPIMSFFVSEKYSSFALDGLGEGSRGPSPSMNGGDFDTWPAYVHPLLRHSAHSLSQKSLEMCTESLGSETGSDEMLFSAMDDDYDDDDYPRQTITSVDEEVKEEEEEVPPPPARRKEPAAVNYHCSSGRSPVRSFPPPLTSICRRDGPCFSMRRRRLDGRLVVEAVPVPSQNYLHVQRCNGRLLLSFIDTTAEEIYPNGPPLAEIEQLPRCATEEEIKDEEAEEVAEVKLSTPQIDGEVAWVEKIAPPAVSADEALKSHAPEKLYFTSKGTMNRGDLLRQLRRCSDNRRPLFFWEPCCVASS